MKKLLFCFILGLVGCNHHSSSKGGAAVSQNAAAKKLWEEVRSQIDGYQVVISRQCFCDPGTLVTTANVNTPDSLQSITAVDGDDVAISGYSPDPEDPVTVDRLFALIEFAEQHNAEVINVKYNKLYGYPEEIYIDRSKMMADEEIFLKVESFAAFIID